MKKVIFFVIIAVFLVLGCGETELYSVSITNNSTKTVSYDYNGGTGTLAVSQTNVYKVKAYTQPPKNILDQNGIASIKMNTDGMTGNYAFTDAAVFALNVVNNLPVEITIKADNFIDDNGSTELTIGENTEKNTARIYTSKPRFTPLVNNYPVTIDSNFDDNDKTVYVIIR